MLPLANLSDTAESFLKEDSETLHFDLTYYLSFVLKFVFMLRNQTPTNHSGLLAFLLFL